MRAALVLSRTMKVTNLIRLGVSDGYRPPDGLILVRIADGAPLPGVGDTWDGSQFISAPEPPIVVRIELQRLRAIDAATTLAELKAALLLGHSLD